MSEWKQRVLVLGLVAISSGLAAEPAPPSDAQVRERVDRLLAQMTLEEKVGQLTQAGGIPFGGAPGPEGALRKGGAGSVLWLNDTKRFNALQKIAVEESRLKIPLLFGFDVIHGYRTIFPIPLAHGGVVGPDRARARRADRGAGGPRRRAEAGPSRRWSTSRATPRWGRIVEGAGEDPYLGAAMARGAGARLPGRRPRRARPAGRLRQALRRLRRRRGRARLRHRRHVRGAAAQRLPAAVQGRGRGRRRHRDERLHGPQRRPRRGQPLAARATSCAASGASTASS